MTTDALNCQRDVARQIVERGGDYALALKGNHRALYADVSQLLDEPRYEAVDSGRIIATADAGHNVRNSCVAATGSGTASRATCANPRRGK